MISGSEDNQVRSLYTEACADMSRRLGRPHTGSRAMQRAPDLHLHARNGILPRTPLEKHDRQAEILDCRAEVRARIKSVRDEVQDVRGRLIDHIDGHDQGGPDD